MGTHGNIAFISEEFEVRLHACNDGYVTEALETLLSIPNRLLALREDEHYYFRFKTFLPQFLQKNKKLSMDKNTFNLMVDAFRESLWLDIFNSSLASYFILNKPSWDPNPIHPDGRYFFAEEPDLLIYVDGSRDALIEVHNLLSEDDEEENDQIGKIIHTFNEKLIFTNLDFEDGVLQYSFAEVFCDMLLQDLVR